MSTCFGLGGHAAGQASREGTSTSTIEKGTPSLNTAHSIVALYKLIHYSLTRARRRTSSLQAKVRQAGMIQWARERSIPMKFAFGFLDRQIVNRGVPMMHQSILVKLPVLIAVRAKPIARIVMRLIGEAHRDPTPFEMPTVP